MQSYRGQKRDGAMEVTAAIELVLPDISNRRLLDRYLEIALRIYEEYES